METHVSKLSVKHTGRKDRKKKWSCKERTNEREKERKTMKEAHSQQEIGLFYKKYALR